MKHILASACRLFVALLQNPGHSDLPSLILAPTVFLFPETHLKNSVCAPHFPNSDPASGTMRNAKGNKFGSSPLETPNLT